MKRISRETAIPLMIALGLGLASAAYTYLQPELGWDASPLLPFENKVLDLKFLRRGRVDVQPKVVIAAGDEKTIAAFGRWGTWDRARFAKVLDNLIGAGAEVVAFDMVFADPPGLDHVATRELKEKLEGARLSESAGTLALAASEGHAPSAADIARVAVAAKDVEDAFAARTNSDSVFAAALDRHATRVVQGFIAEPNAEQGAPRGDYATELDALSSFVIEGYGYGWKYTELDDPGAAGAEQKVTQLAVAEGAKASDLRWVTAVHGELVLPEAAFLEAASNVGFFSADPDADGTLRRQPMVYRLGDLFIPSLSLSAAALYFGGNPGLIAHPFFGHGLMQIGLPREDGAVVDVPVDLNGRLLVNYYGPSGPADPSLPDDKRGAFPRVSLADLHDGTFDAALVKGKVVLIAVTAIGTFDQRVTPFSPMVPGVEIHAAALQNIIDGAALDRPIGVVQIELLLALLVALAFGLLLPRLAVNWGLLFFAGFVLAWLGLDFLVLFPKKLWLFHDVPVVLQMALTWAGITVWGYLTTGREKARLKKEFTSVLAPTVVEQLLKDPALAGLGGTEREMTVMFSDIRGFTTMSEKLTPEGLTAFLNEYLTPMTEILLAREGTLDKYMGDAIMAFWGAPIIQKDHAARAALAAIDMLEKLDQMKKRWAEQGKPVLDIGIGLNSGLMRVGFMGSERMRSYTVLGDNVNLGSRLEGTNKNYGTHLIVSETTYQQARSVAYGRWLDAVRVKGKREPVNIYELLGRLEPGGTPPSHMAKIVEVFEAGMRHYRAKQWDQAESAFKHTIALRGVDPPSTIYLERIAHFREEPPPADWDGVYEFKTK
ncbi:MAG: adenylate/guanylate cyclase domain-containing protein [Deltaproteobacteria bacterium]|nr:adenylate/guanylate cyclase domain-containing protein [Deltaproteobacteria bacterium]